MVSPLHVAKCRISLGMETKFPTFIVCSLLSSKVSPIPKRNVPFKTVTFSSVGCQCAGILVPSAHRSRKTKGAPSAFISPATCARSHPLMIGVHFKFPKCVILGASIPSFFSWLQAVIASAATPTKTARALPARIFFIDFPPLEDWVPGLANNTPAECSLQHSHAFFRLASNYLNFPHRPGWRGLASTILTSSQNTNALRKTLLVQHICSAIRKSRSERAPLLLRKIRVRLHFVDLLGVAFAVRRDEQHKLVPIELSQRTVHHVVAQSRRFLHKIFGCRAALHEVLHRALW